jgi:hypothetical protein
LPQSDTHAPPTSCCGPAQLEHSADDGPLQVRHDGSHCEHIASVVAVQAGLAKVPSLHVEQAVHPLWPDDDWKKFAAQSVHVL